MIVPSINFPVVLRRAYHALPTEKPIRILRFVVIERRGLHFTDAVTLHRNHS